MTIRLLPKLAGETRRYRHDWSPFLGDDTILGEPVTTITGATLDSTTVEDGEQSVVFRVSGGTAGTPAFITHTITTAAGDEETETFILPIGYEEPVRLTDAKEQIRELDDWQDAKIERFIAAARKWVENYTGHILVRRSVSETAHCFSDYLRLTWRPFVSADEAAYTDSDGNPQTITDFLVSSSHYPLRLYPVDGASWPSILTNSPIEVTYTAGYAPGEEPEELLQAILLLVGHWCRFREGVSEDSLNEIPFGVRSLCDQYRTPLV
jgi:uncharacterized phiE125 gp8 family phage protein